MRKTKENGTLAADVRRSRNGEVYYDNKYNHWKEQATVNRIGNFQLAENYLNLELYCEGLKEQLLRYQTFIYENEAYRERASSSMVNQVFPALPMRPQLVSSLYFAPEDRADARVKRIIKSVYRVSGLNVVGGCVNDVVDNVKGKRPVKVLLDRAYKKRIQDLSKLKGSKKVVLR